MFGGGGNVTIRALGLRTKLGAAAPELGLARPIPYVGTMHLDLVPYFSTLYLLERYTSLNTFIILVVCLMSFIVRVIFFFSTIVRLEAIILLVAIDSSIEVGLAYYIET